MTLDGDRALRATNDILRYATIMPRSSNLNGWSIGFEDKIHGFSIKIKDNEIVLDLNLRENQRYLWYRKELDERMREVIEAITLSFNEAGLSLYREGYRSESGSWSMIWTLRPE